MKKTAILLVSFGTSHLDTKEKTLDIMREEIQKTFPGVPVYEAWTSKVILKILARRENLVIPDITAAMEQINRDGIRDLVVQTTHLLNGHETERMKEQVLAAKGSVETIIFGDPLLSTERDYVSVLQTVMEEIREEDRAIVWMGHGTSHGANEVYEVLNQKLRDMGYANGFVGTVEAEPGIDTLIDRITDAGYRQATLLPFLFVAGDHAKNDMAGDDEESWKSRLTAAGCQVECCLKGLGEYSGIQHIYLEHARTAMNELSHGR